MGWDVQTYQTFDKSEQLQNTLKFFCKGCEISLVPSRDGVGAGVGAPVPPSEPAPAVAGVGLREVQAVGVDLREMVDRLTSEMEALRRQVAEVGASTRCAVQDEIGQYRQRERRKCNVVAFGLPEGGRDGDRVKWFDLLRFCGVSVSVARTFRIGRYVKGNPPRPLLVQLGSVGDKYLLLSNVKKLRDSPFSRVFVRADLLPAGRSGAVVSGRPSSAMPPSAVGPSVVRHVRDSVSSGGGVDGPLSSAGGSGRVGVAPASSVCEPREQRRER